MNGSQYNKNAINSGMVLQLKNYLKKFVFGFSIISVKNTNKFKFLLYFYNYLKL